MMIISLAHKAKLAVWSYSYMWSFFFLRRNEQINQNNNEEREREREKGGKLSKYVPSQNNGDVPFINIIKH